MIIFEEPAMTFHIWHFIVHLFLVKILSNFDQKYFTFQELIIQKFGISKIFNVVSYAHQGCIYVIKNTEILITVTPHFSVT